MDTDILDMAMAAMVDTEAMMEATGFGSLSSF